MEDPLRRVQGQRDRLRRNDGESRARDADAGEQDVRCDDLGDDRDARDPEDRLHALRDPEMGRVHGRREEEGARRREDEERDVPFGRVRGAEEAEEPRTQEDRPRDPEGQEGARVEDCPADVREVLRVAMGALHDQEAEEADLYALQTLRRLETQLNSYLNAVQKAIATMEDRKK